MARQRINGIELYYELPSHHYAAIVDSFIAATKADREPRHGGLPGWATAG